MGAWTLDDIPWHRFQRDKLDPEIVRVVKAASLVEQNGAAYAHHLCRVFADDPEFQAIARRWGAEETQHGQALARCVVEIGTSSYYTALREAAAEPVLQEICRHIAADELRHYRLFYKNLDRYLAREPIGRLGRLRVALGRVAESEDDELAYAYYAANEPERAYDRRHYTRAYARRAYALYRPHHIERGVAMLLKAIGLTPNGRLSRVASRLAWHAMRYRAARLAKMAA